MCVCEGETESGRERVGLCFPYIIKRNFVAKTWTIPVDFILLFTVFICLASVVAAFEVDVMQRGESRP